MTPAPPDRAVSTKAVRRGFRDDIQGMRALAVLGILVFHAGIAPYPGGFVTLDVFFVLSGFLITTLLLREVAKTGTIDLVGFYVRRARRILPAATVAIVGTVVASWLWLNPLDARDASVDGVWAALFGANIRFAVEETDYFTATDPPSPLQHFWSLSVEEQFYLVMPLALLASIVVAALVLRRGDGLAHRAGIVTVLALATAASLAWSVHASTASPESAYFSTLSRSAGPRVDNLSGPRPVPRPDQFPEPGRSCGAALLLRSRLARGPGSAAQRARLLRPPLPPARRPRGLGGAAAGEVASATTAYVVAALAMGRPDQEAATLLAEAVVTARTASGSAAHGDDEARDGMATTLTAVLVRGDRVTLAHARATPCE